MDRQEKDEIQRRPERTPEAQKRVKRAIRPPMQRMNPRIVYADPESFFNTMYHDLLMEQSEQG